MTSPHLAPHTVIVAGIGCRSACPPEAVAAVVRQAAARAGLTPTILAVPDRHATIGARAAHLLGAELVLVSLARIAATQHRCPTRSAHALHVLGVASVAEGAALAAAGPDACLLLPRLGEGWATCALAGTSE